ncbi:hypothetical protein L914_06894, partial [Phytophthora nicotianae]
TVDLRPNLPVRVRVAGLQSVRCLTRQLHRVRVGPGGVVGHVFEIRDVNEIAPPVVGRNGLIERFLSNVDDRHDFLKATIAFEEFLGWPVGAERCEEPATGRALLRSGSFSWSVGGKRSDQLLGGTADSVLQEIVAFTDVGVSVRCCNTSSCYCYYSSL